MQRTGHNAARDTLFAMLLAGVLAAVWTWRDWADLTALRLPDADDMIRLQQIRDWLGGQPFADVSQHRLGVTGTMMHWSRLDDLVPGGMIAVLIPMLGRHAAEVAAVIAWPTLLLAAAILLIARIARRVGGDAAAGPAMVVAAIAYPASTLFAPGRIDHHNLQMVLVLVIAWALVRPGTWRTGLAVGGAMALSLVVGMETAPLLVVAAGIVVIEWVLGGSRDRLLGCTLGLGGGVLISSGLFATTGWSVAACDGFAAVTARTAMFASATLGAIALVPLWSPRARLVAAVVAGAGLLAATTAFSPQCLSPYGGVDPLLRRLWLDRVGEAAPLSAMPFAVAAGYAGLMLAGIAASAWRAIRTRGGGGWMVLLMLQLAALGVTLIQVRGAYAGALLGAPALGAMIVAARRRGALPLAGAWLASAGILYPIAAQALVPAREPGAGPSCTSPALIALLARVPLGVVLAPIDTGGPAIAFTRHRLIAAAYHRDGDGNLAMYRFYLGRAEQARAIAAQMGATYVVACDGFAGRPGPDSLAAELARGDVPDWLVRVGATPDGAALYRLASGER